MYKSLIKDASLYSISSVLARGFSFITVPIFTRILSPSDYGALDLLSYFAVFFPLIFGLSLDQAVARFFVSSEDAVARRKIASSVLIYTTFALLLITLSVMPFSGVLANEWLGGQVGPATVRMVLVYVWIHSIFIVVNNQLRYLFLAKKYAACNIGNTVLSMLLSVWFLVFQDMGVYGVFLAQAISQACFSALSFYFGRASYGLVFDLPVLKELVQYSLPLVPGTVAFLGMQYVDRYAINELRSLQEVGLYGIGARLASLINLFLTGFQGAWHPIVMKTYAEDGIKDKYRTVFVYYIFVTCSILVGISLFSEEILLLLTTREFSGGYVVVPLLISSAILASIGNYFTYGIQIRKKSVIRLYINVGGFILNIVLNIVLIRKYGITGAALATFLSFVFMATTSMWCSQKYYKINYQWGRIIVALVIALLVSHVVVLRPLEISLSVLAMKVVAGVAVLVLIARLLEIRHVKTWLSLIRYRQV